MVDVGGGAVGVDEAGVLNDGEDDDAAGVTETVFA